MGVLEHGSVFCRFSPFDSLTGTISGLFPKEAFVCVVDGRLGSMFLDMVTRFSSVLDASITLEEALGFEIF